MAIFVQQGQDAVARWTPPRRATAATASFCSPQGTSLETLSPALDTVSRPILAASNGFSGTLDSGTGTVVAGRRYWLASPGGEECLVTVATVDGADFVLDGQPAVPVAAGGALYGAEFTAAIAAATLENRGVYYRVDWLATMADTADDEGYQQIVHVCRTLFAPAMTPQRAAQYIGATAPNLARQRPPSWFADLAAKASRRVEKLVLKSGRYPQLMGDHDLFEDAGTIALRIELSLEGIVPSGFDTGTFREAQQDLLNSEIDAAVSNNWDDASDDGVVTPADFRPFTTINARVR